MNGSLYPPDYVSVVPRLLPSQRSSNNNQQIPLSDVGSSCYPSSISRSASGGTKGSPSLHPLAPLSTRKQLSANQSASPSQPLQGYSNDSTFKGRQHNGSRLFHEPLKDHSEEDPCPGTFAYSSPPFDVDCSQRGRGEQHQFPSNINQPICSLKIFLLIFAVLISLFSLTALAISIYLLIKLTSTTTTSR